MFDAVYGGETLDLEPPLQPQTPHPQTLSPDTRSQTPGPQP
jgi:hypothetical protein